MKESMSRQFRKDSLALILSSLSLLGTIWIFALERPLILAGLPIRVDVDDDYSKTETWALCDKNNFFVYGIRIPVLVTNYGASPVELSKIEVRFSDEEWNPALRVGDQEVHLPVPLDSQESVNWVVTASRAYENPTTEIVDKVVNRRGEQVLISLYFNGEPKDFKHPFNAEFSDVYNSPCHSP